MENTKVYATVESNSLKGGNLPDGFDGGKITYTFVDDLPEATKASQHLEWECAELKILAQKKLRMEYKPEEIRALDGKVTMKLSTLLEKKPRVVSVPLTPEQIMAKAMEMLLSDPKKMAEFMAKTKKTE